MDRRARQAGSSMLASVVRQFIPSRIERQLLTQVFDVVVAVPRQVEPSAWDPEEDQPPNTSSRLAEGRVSCHTQRRAA